MDSIILRCLLSIFFGAVLSGCQSTKPTDLKQVKTNPIGSHLAQGGRAYLERDWDAAIESYEKALAIDASSLPAMYKLGNIAYRQKKLMTARDYYERVLQKAPAHSMAQYNLAVVNLALAEKHFKFYTATTNDDADITPVSDLLGHIYQFSRGAFDQGSASYSSLDRLAEGLKNDSDL